MRRLDPRFLVFMVLIALPAVVKAKTDSKTITPKYTYYFENRDIACDTAQAAASSAVQSFIRTEKVKQIKLSISECECKLNKSKNHACRATATIRYFKHLAKKDTNEFWQELAKNYVKNMLPTYKGILKPFVKLGSTGMLNGRMLGVMDGTRIFKYVDGVYKLDQRLGQVLPTLNGIESGAMQDFDRATIKMLRDLERSKSTLDRTYNTIPVISRPFLTSPQRAFEQYEKHKANKFRVEKECIQTVWTGKSTELKNICSYPVSIAFCDKSGRRKCGSKEGRFFTQHRLIKPSRTISSSGHVEQLSACAGDQRTKEIDNELVCINPY